ncbi:2186_t:CDS:2 [Funneliformis mosseae]|uniref:2186_t:CDS:1 n=1 Tax=Funneliformis mosseae TaxID=27381 RepID=A0A9N9BMP9_FUNMO|nr:2186_t:CDS:2 [Funneliformis mosseae]
MSEISELQIIPYTSKDYYASKNQQKKREPSMFMSFRKEKMKSKPTDISFADYFDEVTNLWKCMSEVERSEWQKNYNNNQDKKLRKDHKIENRFCRGKSTKTKTKTRTNKISIKDNSNGKLIIRRGTFGSTNRTTGDINIHEKYVFPDKFISVPDLVVGIASTSGGVNDDLNVKLHKLEIGRNFK